MIFVYFIYGLAFFTLGVSLLIYPKKDSDFTLAKTLPLVGLFGIFHAIHEWSHTFYLIQNISETVIIYLKNVDSINLPLSYFFLVLFGTKSICISKNNKWCSILKTIPVFLSLAWILAVILSRWDLLKVDIWSRFLIGVPGTFLTSYALILHLSDLKIETQSINIRIRTAAFTFFFYGIFSGLFVPKSDFFSASLINDAWFLDKTGIPVQIFRTACALVLSYCMISVLSVFDIETKEKLRNLSLKDELTDLLNRRGFTTLAEQQLKTAKRHKNQILLHYIDLDELKFINDNLGHNGGDLALIDIANVLREFFRQSDLIARIGGDEFAVLQLEYVRTDLKIFADRLQKRLEIINSMGNRRYNLSISIGTIRCESECENSVEELLIKADKLMYEHKRSKQKRK